MLDERLEELTRLVRDAQRTPPPVPSGSAVPLRVAAAPPDEASEATIASDRTREIVNGQQELAHDVEALCDEVRNLTSLLATQRAYGDLDWDVLSRGSRQPALDDFASVQIGMPYHVVVEHCGLPLRLDGSFFGAMRAYWKHPLQHAEWEAQAGSRNFAPSHEICLKFDGGLLTHKPPKF